LIVRPVRKGHQPLEAINSYFAELEQMIQSISLPNLEAVLRLLEEAYLNGHRIFIMGNGGSAATASHFALDLAKTRTASIANRARVYCYARVMSLTLTCVMPSL